MSWWNRNRESAPPAKPKERRRRSVYSGRGIASARGDTREITPGARAGLEQLGIGIVEEWEPLDSYLRRRP